MEELNVLLKAMPILLVDDVASARKVLHRMLAKIGCENLHEVEGVQDAVGYLKSHPMGLVIADVHLKDGLGTDILVAWKEHAGTSDTGTPDLPFIFITSDMEKETFRKAVQLGATHYLLKPFTQANLVSKLQEALPAK